MFYEKIADLDGYLKFSKRICDGVCDGDLLPHFHNSIELYVCTKGKYCVYIDGERKIIEEGDVAFVDRLIPHSAAEVVCEGGSEVFFVIANSRYLNGIGWLDKETIPFLTKKHEGFSRIVEVLELAASSGVGMNEEMKRGFITLILGMLKEYAGCVPKVESKSNELLVEVMQYINGHLSERITLEGLARKFGYEKSYFSRVFNKFLGTNLREYLNRLRIGEANRLKNDDPSLTVAQILANTGFDSPNTYYRALKRYGSENHKI